jgi:hypothetical protein
MNAATRFDLHASRMTFNTRLANANVPIRIAMKAMRHSEERLTTAVYLNPNSLPVAAAVASLPALQPLKLSDGLSGDCTTPRHTTQQDATPLRSSEPTLSTHVECVSHAMPHSDTKEKASELLCSEAFIGSGGRDRTYDLVVNSHPLYR